MQFCPACGVDEVTHKKRSCIEAMREEMNAQKQLLQHCKMYIFEGTGYSPTEEEELDLMRSEFKKLGFSV